ncbi:MAG TPA: hypothetical protein VMR21_02265, partial [Vicinamibacteria bacterium]|nr:hypothetical protein [Vicinamibacteria bacterium]
MSAANAGGPFSRRLTAWTRPLFYLGQLLVFVAAALAGSARADEPAATPAPLTAQDCLACHGDPDLTLTLGTGETQSLFVDAEA